MAFNPFNVFRRYQKTLFAGLTIFVMVMFVFSFGQGDLFQWLPKWLGSKKGQGEVVAVVDGRKIYDSDLGHRDGSRELASQFMLHSADAAAGRMAEYVQQTAPTVSRENRTFFLNTVRDRRTNYMNVDLLQYMPVQQLQSYSLRMLFSRIDAILNAQPPLKDDADLARVVRNMVELDLRKTGTGEMGYFGHRAGGEAASRKSSLDFDLWLKKADKLGVRYSAEDAKQIFAKEFYNQFDDGKALADVEKNHFLNKPSYSREALFQALADEFKARTAQAVVLGNVSGGQGFSTPYEMYTFYKKECVGATYALVAVPAENYLDAVPGSPTEGQLREIFAKYRNVEVDPSKPSPGLREPRKLKLGWLEVKGDETSFEKISAETLRLGELNAKAAAFTVAPLFGSAWGAIAAPIVANVADAALMTAYDAYKDKFRQRIDTEWFPFSMDRSGALDSAVAKPALVGTAVAMAAGSAMTWAGPLVMPLAVAERVRAEDRQDRARVLGLLLMPGNEFGGNAVGRAVAAGLAIPAPPPLSAVRAELVQKVKIDRTRAAAEAELAAFQKEAKKLGEKKDKSEARGYIEKFAAERGLKLGGSTEFRDKYALGGDPGLKLLNEKLDRGMVSPLPIQFGQTFFNEANEDRQLVPAVSFYNPQQYPATGERIALSENESSIFAWRTEELFAESPKDFDKAKPKAEAIWRRLKARELAKQAADEMAKQTSEKLGREPGGDQGLIVERTFRDIYSQFRDGFKADPVKYERAGYDIITDVAPVTRDRMSFTPQGANGNAKAFQLPPSRFLPYPSLAMRQVLLDNKDKKPGTVLVLPDAATDIYYVAVLKERQPAGSNEFYTDVYNGVGDLSQAVNGRLQQESRNKAIDTALGLLRAEFKVEKENDKLVAKGPDAGE